MLKKKRLIAIVSTLIVGSLLIGCSGSSSEKKIGVLQLIQHSALDSANKGFIDGLKEKGYEDGKNIKIEQQNAQGKIDTAQQIAGQFVTSNKDLIFSIATPTTQAVLNATKDIPIVFTAVTDPVSDGIADSLDSSKNNTTGTSDKVNIDEQLALLKELVPNAKTLGFIYTTSETNSVNQLKELKELAKKYNLEVKEIGIANINEISQNLTNGLSSVDALYAPTDNNVAASYDLVAKICLDNKVPVMGAEPAIVEKGGLVSKGLDYYELGKMAGYKAAEILNGTKPTDIKIETMPELKITINTDTAKALNITIPDSIDKNANKVTGGAK